MVKKRINQIHEVEAIDFKTGEIDRTVTDTSYTIDAEPAFIKLYLADLLYLNDLQTNQAGLLHALLQKMNYDNQIVLNAALKREIAQKLKISVGTLDNNLSKFCKGKILKRQDRGIYIANPHLFGKGTWHEIVQNRNAHIDMTINYTESGRSFNAFLSQSSNTENEVTNTENEPKPDKTGKAS